MLYYLITFHLDSKPTHSLCFVPNIILLSLKWSTPAENLKMFTLKLSVAITTMTSLVFETVDEEQTQTYL